MDTTWLRHAKQLQYRLPGPYLASIKKFEPEIAQSSLPENVKHLRTNKLKPYRELREAALFCHGMSLRIGQPVYLAHDESQDYDFVASWIVGDTQHLAPVQLKEVVPADINPNCTLESVIDGLRKYVKSTNLTIAIHLNQSAPFDPKAVVIPELNVGSLWIFGSVSTDGSEWAIWGDFLSEGAHGTRYAYPAA